MFTLYFIEPVKNYVLFIVACLCCFALGAQTESFFYQKFDCQTGTTMCFDADSNLWLGCTRNNQPLLVKVDREGILLEQVPINMPFGQSNILTELILDSDGMLVGCGFLTPVNPVVSECSFVFRYNPKTQQVLWCRRMVHGFPAIRGIIEQNTGGNFLIYAYNYSLTDIIDIALLNRQTGQIETNYNRSYKIGNSEDPRAAVLHQGELYVAGKNDLGYLSATFSNLYTQQGLWKIDSIGVPQWTLLGSVPVNQKSDLYGQDLLIENNHIISISSGREQTSGNAPSRIFLQKTTLDGAMVWIKKYDITNFGFGSETACDVVSTPDGFVILGNGGDKGDYILKTDKNGDVQWAQGLQSTLDYLSPQGFVKPQSRMMTDGKALYILSATLENQQKKTVLIKTDLNGYVPGCSRLSPLNPVELPMNNPQFSQFPLKVSSSTASMPELASEQPAPILLNTSKDCRNEGADIENPCAPPTFALQLGIGGGPFYASCLTVSPDSNVLVAGQSGDSAVLAAFSPEGKLLWCYTFDALPGESITITSIRFDSDGLLFGCGYLTDVQQQHFKLAFRYDPNASQLLWSKRLFTLDPVAGGIVENTSSGHYLLYHNVRLADGRQVPETLQLERNSGALINLSGRRYEVPDANQVFGDILFKNGTLYAAGRQQSGGKTSHVIESLSAAFGGPLWTVLNRPDTAADAGCGGFDGILYDDFHVVTAYSGNPTNGTMPPARLYLQKTGTADGDIAWIRYFNIPNVVDLELFAVPGAYVVLGRTGLSTYILIKTDRNGNLLVSKTFDAAGTPGSGLLPAKTQSRIAQLGKYLFFLLTDDRLGEHQTYLVKTDLNFEITGGCGQLKIRNATDSSSKNLVNTPFNQPAVVTLLNVQEQSLLAHPSALMHSQICPPVYIEPKPELGFNRPLCPSDTLLISTAGVFVAYQWQDGSTSPVIKASSPGVYTLQATTLCGNVVQDTIELFPELNPVRHFVLHAAPGVGVSVGNGVYFSPDTVVLTKPSLNGFCDTLLIYVINPCSTITTNREINFYPGQTILLDSLPVSQPGVYTRKLQTVFGCDSLVTYTTTWIITDLNVYCPPNLVDTAELGVNTKTLFYATPAATTNCPDSTILLEPLKGPLSGGLFPLGTTEVCYQASNACGIKDTCCFAASVVPTNPPCDVKSAGNCLRVELLDKQFDEKGDRRYRLRLTNNCSTAVEYVTFQLPSGVSATSPLNGQYYSSPFGSDYLVRNPNASPFHSIRFKAQDQQLKNSASDIFTYSLPQQSQPAYINVFVRFVDKTDSETHLSVLGCPTLPWPGVANRVLGYQQPSGDALLLWPNPTAQSLHLQLSAWQGHALQISLLNAQGVLVHTRYIDVVEPIYKMELPTGLMDGLYHLIVRPSVGEGSWGRFVLAR